MTKAKLSYDPLWKLLIDKKTNRTKLQKVAGISAATIAKLGKGGNVTTDILVRICVALDCQIEDICEVTQEESGGK